MAYDPRGDHGASGGHEGGGFVRARGRRKYLNRSHYFLVLFGGDFSIDHIPICCCQPLNST
ncbi:hypothetical protein M434DRAFT_393486 [Hypoxylon sp. CO27-5]|nr:hypothetical protein M434DRAFT_393486 [Hypoxylon sp. CO27-5]